MKSLLLFILILITAGNLYSQAEKQKEKPQEKPKEKLVEVPAPVVLKVEEGSEEGVDQSLTEPPPPPPELVEPKGEEPFAYVEQMPSFPEGTEAMYKFISDNLIYPELAKQNGISGQVIVQFVISRDGSVTGAKVVRGIGGGCNEEALRVINAMPKWNPGKHNGKEVPVIFTLPVRFVRQ